MALWIINRPKETAEPAECLVADCLSRLQDDWVICWGYRYGINGSIEHEHDGDFVVQGPTGHVCTIQVKSGQLRQLVLTGSGEHDDRDNPAEQLHRECQGVITLLESVSGGDPIPFVHQALALPNMNFVEGDKFRNQLSRSQIIDQGDLNQFSRWWTENVTPNPLHLSPAKARECFSNAFSSESPPKAFQFFISETDRLILRQADAESRILDMVADNQQLVVEGGCGSGKTFLAIEQARRWAELGTGQRVLFLCCNVTLNKQLADMVKRHPTNQGEIVVLNWEAIATMMLEKAGIEFRVPKDSKDRWNYFHADVPRLLLAMLDDGKFSSEFDALVIDEAQDHDTRFPPEFSAGDKPGWWSFYFPLLHQNEKSRIAIFYDSAQRPIFRDPSGFSIDRLIGCFSQPARVRLPHSLRYTRPVYDFLRKLTVPGSSAYGASLGSPLYLGEGPEVVICESTEQETASRVTAIAKEWIGKGLCLPRDILILGSHRDRSRTSLGDTQELGSIPLCDYAATTPPGSIPYLSIHRSKGLDRLAIILIDLPPWTELLDHSDEQGLETYFTGASLARQLLAVVHRDLVLPPSEHLLINPDTCPYCNASLTGKKHKRNRCKNCRKTPHEVSIAGKKKTASKSSGRTSYVHDTASIRRANARYMRAQFESRSD